DSDNDFMQVNVEAAQGTSYYKMVDYVTRISELLRRDSNIEFAMTQAGNGNRSQAWVQLKPRAQRELSVAQVIEKLRPQVSNFPGIRVFMNVPPSLRIGGRNSNSSYQLTVQAPDTDELYKQAEILRAEILKVPEVLDISTDLQMKSPLMTVKIDRER